MTDENTERTAPSDTDPLARIKDAVTPDELAQALGVTVRTVRSEIARGDLPAMRVFNRVLISREDVSQWIESKRLRPAGSSRAIRNPNFGRSA